MKKNIITHKYNWTEQGKLRCSGFAWQDGRCVSEGDFCEAMEQHCQDFDSFSQWATQLNGPFSIIVEQENEIWMATSHTWAYPLFYAHGSEGCEVGDVPELFAALKESGIRIADELYFLSFGVAPGNHTLCDRIKTVMPGETIRLRDKEIQSVNALDSIFQTRFPESEPEVTAQRIRETFQRYSDKIGKRKVLLPLTSGYDSRLLACLLKESGHTDVLCATWGNPGNSEQEAARRVAGQLGYPYRFIPYTSETVAGFTKDPEFEKFAMYIGHLTSMPYLQEYFAIRQLLNEGLIDKNTIVLPGHPGDFLRGSHLTQGLSSEENKLVAERILDRFGADYPLSSREKQMVYNKILEYHFTEKPSADNRVNFDRWDYIERQCKLVSNSSMAWSFFGVETLHPLFDRELVSFFPGLPVEQRLGSVHYLDTLVNQFFQKHGVDFMLRKENIPSNGRKNLKRRLVSLLPDFLKKWVYQDANPIGYREITAELMRSFPEYRFKTPARPYAYNSYLIQWYLQLMKNMCRFSEDGRG